MNKDVYDFSYGNDTSLNRLDISSSQNLQLYFKIPPRRFINWNYNHEDECKQNYIPDYNNLVIEYRSCKIGETFDTIWNNLLSVPLPDPSNQNLEYGTGSNNYKNDLCMNFILDISKDNDSLTDTGNIIITENSFNIIYKYGKTISIIKISHKYQFRLSIQNYSTFDISQIPGIIPNHSLNQYNESINAVSWNYLYFPSDVNNFYSTLVRGNPLQPTNLNFFYPTNESNNFSQVSIDGSLDNLNADSNSIISFPINQEDNYIVFTLDLSGHKSSTYKKAIPYSANNLLIDFSNGPNSVKLFTETISTSMYDLQPEYVYDVSAYGIYFKDASTNITYVTLPNNTIDNSFTISHPLRDQVNITYDNLINNYTIFNSESLVSYRSDICYTIVTWRADNQNKLFNFFTDTSSIFDISYSLDINLYNSTHDSSIDLVNEPRGKDLSGNNLSTFQLSTYKNTAQKHSSTQLQTTGTFDISEISIPDISFTLNLKTQDITGSISPYTRQNGYYIGTTITDISYAIDLNNFFDIATDLSDNNIKFKPQISQIFPTDPPTQYNNSAQYPIYKITDDLTQSFVIETSSITISENSGTPPITTSPSPATYFGLTSKQPNKDYELIANGSINISGLNQYIRSTTDSLGSLTITVNGTNTPTTNIASYTINSYAWPSSGTNNKTLPISQTFKPFSNSTFTADYGTYEENFQYQAVLSGTLYNNAFTPGGSKSINPIITISNYNTNLTTNYFWDTTRADTTFFLNNSMIQFNSFNPLTTNTNPGTLYNVSDPIIYNQALFQYNYFYGSSYNVYTDYSIYDGNSNNYTSFKNNGDELNSYGNIGSSNSWNNQNIGTTSANKFKWICIRLDTSIINSRLGDNGLILYPTPSLDNIFYFIKTNKSNGWYNCQLKRPSSWLSITTGGIYETSITPGSEMKVVIPYLPYKSGTNIITEIDILIGLNNNTSLSKNDINYSFWV
jgi:hypothetical protein